MPLSFRHATLAPTRPLVLPVNHLDTQPQKRSLSRTLPMAVLMFTIVPLFPRAAHH